MNADQRHRHFMKIAQHQHEGVLRFVLHAEEDQLEQTVPRGEFCFGNAVDQLFANTAVANQIIDRDDFQIVLDGQLEQSLSGGPIAGRTKNFAQHASRCQAGQTGQVDRAFSVTSTA